MCLADGLVEVLWKRKSGIISCQLLSSIQFLNTLHGLCTGRGMGASTLKGKLLRKLIDMRETVIHYILLDLHKAYDALDR